MMKRFLLLPLVLLSGCLSSHSETAPRPGEEYAERVVAPRAERILERRELVLAVLSGPELAAASAAVWSVLEKKDIGLKIIPLARRESLSPMLRDGRVDLIAGGYTPEEVRTLHLTPVLLYTGADGQTRCCAVRYGDHLLTELLGAVPADDSAAERKEKEK